MKLELVEGWQRAWKWGSMQLHLIATTLAGILLMVPSMPAEIQAVIPEKYRALLIGVWFIVGVLARVTRKSPCPPEAAGQ